jgi:DNA-binding response OmpR family regulator
MTGVPATNEESKLHAVIDGLLAKPFSISELLAKLAHVTGS